jgi:methyl-accepting chemotaxis protein
MSKMSDDVSSIFKRQLDMLNGMSEMSKMFSTFSVAATEEAAKTSKQIYSILQLISTFSVSTAVEIQRISASVEDLRYRSQSKSFDKPNVSL